MSPRPARVTPHELSVDWPHAPCDDPIAEVARLLVVNLLAAIGDRSVREIASLTGVDRATIGAVIKGLSWPDIMTLARLERGLGLGLWPGNNSEISGKVESADRGVFVHEPYVRGQFLPRNPLDG